MDYLFADRLDSTPKSFIREILKVTKNSEVISFAGGLPNPNLFPVADIAGAAANVLAQNGAAALQYSTTEGYWPLRERIAHRYRERFGLKAAADDILITNGSQQGLDLLGKIFLNKGDQIIIERPGYLGAIQSFSLYQPQFLTVPLLDDGPDLEFFEKTLAQSNAKFFYTVSNFQNPSGVTYAPDKRRAVAELLRQHNVILIEDDPYGELRFSGQDLPPIRRAFGDDGIMLGTFSKIVAPGLRLGWIYARPAIMEKLIIAKQASDLHSNNLAQRIIEQYLQDNDLNAHLDKIRAVYKTQRDLMVGAMCDHFPVEVRYVVPDGGMFLWLTLPEGLSSMKLFEVAAGLNVVFVPGQAFYVDGGGDNTLRLNYSNSNPEKIAMGMGNLAQALAQIIAEPTPAGG